ncbi:S1 RNA-binding domain-containing protein 1-like [Uloborus diversus]|uniref:S1 RNA-binding domain-containing protein 1-like n=1 Tax=Uloborus diversus TaxID=327109 RepID=UPI002409988A|nr:S1 RNA-binding domain-containing protein 1-like [Uloborus diversus]XP_054714421.1 S1 RNA-binding domain-containing protein 1-like [Uloborus diversus]XP_054714422.1 S1 RNA-binding domain-containing protein 1-like [Uloborus diversus]
MNTSTEINKVSATDADSDIVVISPPRKKRKVAQKVVIIDSEDEESALSEADNDDDFVPSPEKQKPKAKASCPRKNVKKSTASVEGKKKTTAVKRKAANPDKPVKKRKVAKKTEVPADVKDKIVPSSSKEITQSLDETSVAEAIQKARLSAEPWKDEEVVAETAKVPLITAKNVISLLNQECTIPFIVRYRKEMTGGLLADKIRDIQEAYEEVKTVHKKVEAILKTVKNEKFFDKAAVELLSAKTLDEVELLYAPFKPGSKKSLAEKSKQLGLEGVALQLLNWPASLTSVNVASYVKPVKGLETEEKVLEGVKYIIADVISKDRRILDFVRQRIQCSSIRILSSKSSAAEKLDRQAHVEGKTTQNFKYENYFSFNMSLTNVAPHQVMALNRGEKQKVLTVKVQIPIGLKKSISEFCWNTFFHQKRLDRDTFNFLRDCFDDSYNRLIEPYMCRQIRSNLTKTAEKESIAVFGSNVKSLLLTPPVRGKTVIGIDPGFSHGCKIAAVSSKGEVLCTDVIFIHSKVKQKFKNDLLNENKLRCMIFDFKAEIIAIGNGTACRETEAWLSDLNNSNFFAPFKVKYCIINESGASIWSVTKEAEEELPNMDPNIRSAVSIARRLQDPLLEYVKVEPKHLGVGMYQHDIAENQLKSALDSVVEECVSFVGVDLNVCPEVLLRKISGLSSAKVKQIIAYRTQKGYFINRQQLLKVKGLGPKTFEQCAGFVKILPETSLLTSSLPTGIKEIALFKPNPLDQTIIHPESYSVAEKFLEELKGKPSEIGQQSLVEKVNSHLKFTCVEDLAKKYNIAVSAMQLIIDAFKQLQGYDIRGELSQPLFMTSVQKLTDLKNGQVLTGRVCNMTGFGAFVDIGVGQDGLIHTTQMQGQKLSVGDRVTVKVMNVDVGRKRIGLQLSHKNDFVKKESAFQLS